MTFPCYRMNLVAVVVIGFFASQAEGRKEGDKVRCLMRQHETGLAFGIAKFGVWWTTDNTQSVSFSAYIKHSTIKVGNHGFHIHENPITGKDCATAGGHYNPNGKNHGSLFGTGDDMTERHVGDLGNVYAGDGTIDMEVELKVGGEWDAPFSLQGEQTIMGRSVVLHVGEDDLGLGGQSDSLTTGHAGGRLACCTLKVLKKNKNDSNH